jgi:hypothetical protein
MQIPYIVAGNGGHSVARLEHEGEPALRVPTALESLKGKRCCRQLKFYSGVPLFNFALVLPFKDSQGGTSSLELSEFKRNSLRRHAPVKKQTQYADRAKAFAPSNPRSRHKRGG